MSIQKSIDEAVEKVHAELAKNKLAQKEIAALKAGNAELVEALKERMSFRRNDEMDEAHDALIAKHGSKE